MFWKRCSCFGGKKDEETKPELSKTLDFSHMRLDNVPSEVFLAERILEELYLDSNLIRDLPRQLFHCTGLLTLSLCDNDIQILPQAVAALINLEKLNLNKNAIIEVPENIRICTSLKSVDLSVNPLGKLPEGITQLINLRELYLNDVFLELLPANFGRLSKLQILELRENRLKTLPKSLSRLTELRRLDIGQNDLDEIPEVIGDMPNLSELWLDNNRIEEIPTVIGNLKKLSYLDASNNRICEISEAFGQCENLSDITLSCNKIKTLPNSICNLRKLTVIRLDKNELTFIPHNFGSCEALEELIANYNVIKSIPTSVGSLRNLQNLILDTNDLTELPDSIGSCTKLRVLSLSNNSLTHLPDELGRLSSLKVLNLSGNYLKHLPLSVAKLTNIKALWLSENQQKPLMKLQPDIVEGGQKVLTCFLLPQQGPLGEDYSHSDSAGHYEHSPDHAGVKFSGMSDTVSGGPVRSEGLLRNPTPYPKELKAHAKHAKNLAFKNRATGEPDIVGDNQSEKPPERHVESDGVSEPRTPVAKTAAIVRSQTSSPQVHTEHGSVKRLQTLPNGHESDFSDISSTKKLSTVSLRGNLSPHVGKQSELHVYKNLKGTIEALEQGINHNGSHAGSTETNESHSCDGFPGDEFRKDIANLQRRSLSMPKSRKTLALDVSHLNALNESTVAHAGDQSNMSILNETIISPARSNSYIMPHINQNSSRSSSAVYASNYHQSSYSSCIQQSALPPNIRSLRSPVNAAHNPVNRLFATDHAMYHESSVELRSPVYNPALQSPQTMHYPSPFHKPGGSVKTDQFSDSSSLSSANSLSVTKNLDSINYHTFPVIIVKNPDLGFAVTDSLKDAVNEKNASVSAVKMNGPASTALKVGDRILRIDDIDLCNVDHETVKAILNSTGPTVSLLVRRNAANVKYL